MKKLRRTIITMLILALLLPMLPFHASAGGSYTLNVGDTKYLSFSSGGKAIISSLWSTNAPNSVGFVDTYLTSCQIKVTSYTSLQPVIISCTYYYQDLIGNYIYTFSGYEDFRIRINPSDCSVYLDPCGGSVSPSYITVRTGSTYGNLPTPTRTGGSFAGWYTSSSGGSRVYSSTTVTATSDHTLYAHWDYDRMTVNFDPNGGTVDTKTKTVTYTYTYGTLPTPVREGYGFIGWFTAAEGGSQIKSSSYVNRTSDHTLYAHWCNNHNYSFTKQTDPTCTAPGSKRYDCSYCDKYYTETLPALGHSWSGLECTRCGATRLTTFDDVQPEAFYEEPVAWAVENSITNGATATTFNPGGSCLRAQVVTFLHRAAKNPEPTSTKNPFSDVKTTDYFYKPVLWAVEKNITNGTSANKFGSYDVCNRAAVVTFLWRTVGEPEPASADNPFVDVTDTDYFYKPVLWAVENGITSGVDATHFAPASPCNRAQVVTFLYRARDLVTNVPGGNEHPDGHYAFVLTSNDPSEEIGFISVEESSFAPGEEVIFYAEPNFGYLVELESSPADLELDYIGMGYYSMVMPAHDVAISANFYPAEGDYHYITGQVTRCNVVAVCDDDTQGNLIAKPGERVYIYIIPDNGYPYINFGIFVNDKSYDNMWYLGMIEDDPDYGTFHIVEFEMPDADVELEIVCSATASSNSIGSPVPKAFPSAIPNAVIPSTPIVLK